jgi:hypothetical protein
MATQQTETGGPEFKPQYHLKGTLLRNSGSWAACLISSRVGCASALLGLQFRMVAQGVEGAREDCLFSLSGFQESQTPLYPVSAGVSLLYSGLGQFPSDHQFMS